MFGQSMFTGGGGKGDMLRTDLYYGCLDWLVVWGVVRGAEWETPSSVCDVEVSALGEDLVIAIEL